MNVLEQRQAEAVVSIAKTLRTPDWERRRYEIAKDILSTMFFQQENHSLTVEADVDFAVEVADILIEKLKKGE
ncbi:MAG: hypothetical protein SO082_08355 [Candidatus Limisoma sp.]|nr:hypothetical protein [Candidatus Limisoma sp.]